MGISEEKMKIVINNYFKSECDVNTSIREAFEKGFRVSAITTKWNGMPILRRRIARGCMTAEEIMNMTRLSMS